MGHFEIKTELFWHLLYVNNAREKANLSIFTKFGAYWPTRPTTNNIQEVYNY